MIKTELEKIFAILEKTDINDYDTYETLWNQEVELITTNLQEAILFIKNDCSETALSWISEVLEKIIDKTHSQEFLNAFKETANKYPSECETYDIEGSIKIAEAILKKS